jgi:branched-chain amino acid aminotransferase
MAGSQDFAPDPRNAGLKVWLNGDLVPRDRAMVSIFDAGWILGDGIWEGLRMHGGRLAFLDRHLDRLRMGARAIDLEIGMDRAGLVAALDAVLAANGMTGQDGAHLRLMVTRGLKATANQDPRNTLGPATVAITAEWKLPGPALWQQGLKLFTSAVRTTRPDQFDMSLNTHSRLPYITALIQAIKAGADEALMLDDRGYVASCNATNFFIVRRGTLITSTGATCFRGITRAALIEVAALEGIACHQRDFSLAEVYDADEAFVTGTFGGVTPVASVDGRDIPRPGSLTARLKAAYQAYARVAD